MISRAAGWSPAAANAWTNDAVATARVVSSPDSNAFAIADRLCSAARSNSPLDACPIASSQRATAGVLAHPFGQFLVAVAGLAILALGVGLAIYGAKRMFERRLMTYRMNEATRQSARRLGQFGYIAKGVAFAIVGLLLADAALSNNPAKSRGLDTALRTVIAQPFGQWLLILVAVGFAAFGIYCFLQSRYRKVTT